MSAAGVKVNGQGSTVVPYLTPYGMNSIDIDPKGTSSDVELQSTSEHTVPRLGYGVMLEYKMVSGRAALIHAPQADDQGLPFGAEVIDEKEGQLAWLRRTARFSRAGWSVAAPCK